MKYSYTLLHELSTPGGGSEPGVTGPYVIAEVFSQKISSEEEFFGHFFFELVFGKTSIGDSTGMINIVFFCKTNFK